MGYFSCGRFILGNMMVWGLPVVGPGCERERTCRREGGFDIIGKGSELNEKNVNLR